MGRPRTRRVVLGISILLVAAAIVFISRVLIADWQQIIELPWENYLPIIPLILILHFLSTAAQLFVWLLIISHVRRIDRRDLQIFSSMLLVRYLPGTAWNILGRITTYASITKTDASHVWAGTLMETSFLLLSGLGLAIATLDSLGLFLKILAIGLTIALGIFAYSRMDTDESAAKRITKPVILTSLLFIAWICGGVILYLLAQGSQQSLLDIRGAVRIWVVVGSIGFLLNILPIRFGIRQSVFMLLLSPFLPLTAALVTVFLMGVVMLIADALWGGTLWAISSLAGLGKA